MECTKRDVPPVNYDEGSDDSDDDDAPPPIASCFAFATVPRPPPPIGKRKRNSKANEASKTKATAFDGHTKAAEAGSARAMNAVGLCYDSGRGVPKDMAKAIEWYTKAAEKGYSSAMINLGGIHDDEAKEWKAKAAQTGHKASKAAMDYLAGYHEQKAKEWYTKAKATNNEADEASKTGGKRNATDAGIGEPSDATEDGAPVTPDDPEEANAQRKKKRLRLDEEDDQKVQHTVTPQSLSGS